MDVHLQVHHHFDRETIDLFRAVVGLLERIMGVNEEVIAKLDELATDVEAQGTVVSGAVVMIDGLRKQVTDLQAEIAAGGDAAKLLATVKERLTAIDAGLDTERDKLAAALVSGTAAEDEVPEP